MGSFLIGLHGRRGLARSNEARLDHGAVPDRDVDPILHEVRRSLRDPDVKRHIGVSLEERRKARNDEELAEARSDCDADATGRRTHTAADARLRGFELADGSCGGLEEIATGLCQRISPRSSHQQLSAEVLLERCDLLAYRRLPDAELPCDGCKTPAAFDDANEDLDRIEPVHRSAVTPSPWSATGYHGGSRSSLHGLRRAVSRRSRRTRVHMA